MKHTGNKFTIGNTNKKSRTNNGDKSSKVEKAQVKEDRGFLGKKQKRQRQENSLDELTRSFLKYVKENKSQTININDIVKKLKVKKRRIYDITNVLEGIFL